MSLKQSQLIFYGLLLLSTIALFFTANDLSISYKEALNVLDNFSVLTLVTYLPLKLFGYNDIALRLPFITLYLLSAVLMFELTKNYFKFQKDRLISIAIFMLLPGVISASLLVNSAMLVTFFTLLYIYVYRVYNKHSYLLLFLCLFVDNSFAIFYLALFFFALSRKENKLLIISLVLFTLSMYIYGFESTGKPRGHFVDTFGIYASIFSPLLFLYFIYAIYRVGVKAERTLQWYISATALIFSLLFAFRQKVYIEDFAPFVIIAIPMMVRLFLHSYRVRLPQFRVIHSRLAAIALGLLCLSAILVLLNKPLYLFLKKPTSHFAYNYHVAKELSQGLKQLKIDQIYSADNQLIKRLEFYGLNRGWDYYITIHKPQKYEHILAIIYYDKEIERYYIVKR